MFHIQSDSSGCLFNTQKIISAENLYYAGERGRDRQREIEMEREREGERNCNEDVLTTGNLVVLQLEFPSALLVGFICIDVASEVVCFLNKGAGVC